MKTVEIMVHITQNTYGNGGALIWAVMESWWSPSGSVRYCAQTHSHWKHNLFRFLAL